MGAVDKNKFWAELDALDEDQVREKVGLGLYATRRKDYAEEWLRQKEQERTNERYEHSLKKPWHKSLPVKIIIGVLIAVVAGLGVLYLADLLGIPSTPITNK